MSASSSGSLSALRRTLDDLDLLQAHSVHTFAQAEEAARAMVQRMVALADALPRREPTLERMIDEVNHTLAVGIGYAGDIAVDAITEAAGHVASVLGHGQASATAQVSSFEGLKLRPRGGEPNPFGMGEGGDAAHPTPRHTREADGTYDLAASGQVTGSESAIIQNEHAVLLGFFESVEPDRLVDVTNVYVHGHHVPSGRALRTDRHLLIIGEGAGARWGMTDAELMASVEHEYSKALPRTHEDAVEVFVVTADRDQRRSLSQGMAEASSTGELIRFCGGPPEAEAGNLGVLDHENGHSVLRKLNERAARQAGSDDRDLVGSWMTPGRGWRRAALGDAARVSRIFSDVNGTLRRAKDEDPRVVQWVEDQKSRDPAVAKAARQNLATTVRAHSTDEEWAARRLAFLDEGPDSRYPGDHPLLPQLAAPGRRAPNADADDEVEWYPGVTLYAATQPAEDWAESSRLLARQWRRGRVATDMLGEPVRFKELLPNRWEFKRRLYDLVGDIDTRWFGDPSLN